MAQDETTQGSSSILKNALDFDFGLSSSKEKQVLSEPCSPNGDSEPESVESVPEEGGLTAWLVVFACFLLSFNCLGVSYSFGMLSSLLVKDANLINACFSCRRIPSTLFPI